ncbi:hypothetical protein CRG98_021132 [Punica granatum]|uniref:glycerophosphodiester phosphodiesterase n=1 Tax=Punica granatum TaxID=22663 RepID=A0A2I0JQ82_PUNGR|nr:hypothetical protein CRG98_021132 [Punica granatum]
MNKLSCRKFSIGALTYIIISSKAPGKSPPSLDETGIQTVRHLNGIAAGFCGCYKQINEEGSSDIGANPPSTMFVRRHQQNAGFRRFQMKVKFPRRRPFRIFIACLAFIALLPPLFLHFRLSSLHQAQLRRCAWLRDPPLVCAHGGDTTEAFANTMAAFHAALHSQVDCIEIDVSRSSDGILLALHDRDLQRITGDRTSRVGHLTSRELLLMNLIDDEEIENIDNLEKLLRDSVFERHTQKSFSLTM